MGSTVEMTTKHSLGITSNTGKTIVVIPKDTPLPAQRSLTVTTARDDQRNIGLIITLGERPEAEDNFQFSRIRLDDIKIGPKGEAKVRLIFRGFVNGLWSVGVQYREDIPERQLSIIPSAGLSQDDIELIKEKATKYIEDNKPAGEAEPATMDVIPLPAI